MKIINVDGRLIIALLIIVLFAAAYVRFHDNEMTGALIGAFSGAWGYYLGSSKSSADKDAKIPDAAP